MTGQVLKYERASTLDSSGRLELATAGGVALRAAPSAPPRFFAGFLTSPNVAAEGLRAVAQVAAAAYVRRPDPGMAMLDPVATSNGDRLRFESFSSCGGVQARLDILGDGLDGDLLDRGTTNVDINEPLRRLLARVAPGDPLHLDVGLDQLVVTTRTGSGVERKVALSARWLRGFAAAQELAASFEPRVEVDAAAGSAFLASLKAGTGGWVVPAGRSLRLTSRPLPGAVHLAGSQRLEALIPLLRHASRLRVYGPAVTTSSPAVASAWEVSLPGARLVLLLSPAANRGFSGEGAGLEVLLPDEAVDDADSVADLLAFEPVVDLALLAERTGLPTERVRSAVACLASAGRVGYDLAEASHFHRELPYDRARVEVMNPRLAGARNLVAADAVRLVDDHVAEVTSSEVHRVRRRPDGTMTCTCRWWTTHQGSRGPCKHVLATTLVRGNVG